MDENTFYRCSAWRYDHDANEYAVAEVELPTQIQAERWMKRNCPDDGDVSATEYLWDATHRHHYCGKWARFANGDDVIEWWN